MTNKETVSTEVSVARALNWVALRYSKAGYPNEAKRTRAMSKLHLSEARLALR